MSTEVGGVPVDATLARAERVLGQRTVASAMGATRAVIGVGKLPVGEEEAQRCLDKLRSGDEPTTSERVALDLVMRMLRPAVPVKDGRVGSLPDYADADEQLRAKWPGLVDASSQFIPAVGRIDDGEGRQVGTGFLIGTQLVATNHHVLHQLSFGRDELWEGSATINFGFEFDTANSDPAVSLVAAAAIHPTRDVALLRTHSPVARASLAMNPVPLAVDTRIVTIGFPALGSGPPPVFASVFQGGFGIKRVSPGAVLTNDGVTLAHDCSTLGGSSGSAVMTLDDPRVVAVHFEGLSAYENKAVPVGYLAELLERVERES